MTLISRRIFFCIDRFMLLSCVRHIMQKSVSSVVSASPPKRFIPAEAGTHLQSPMFCDGHNCDEGDPCRKCLVVAPHCHLSATCRGSRMGSSVRWNEAFWSGFLTMWRSLTSNIFFQTNPRYPRHPRLKSYVIYHLPLFFCFLSSRSTFETHCSTFSFVFNSSASADEHKDPFVVLRDLRGSLF